MKNTFNKQERLCSKIYIDLLFNKGKSVSGNGLKLIFFEAPATFSNTQAMFVVPKKLFKRANKRNILKRRLKEAYRLTKNDFYKMLNDKKLLLAFIYTHKNEKSFVEINEALLKLLANEKLY